MLFIVNEPTHAIVIQLLTASFLEIGLNLDNVCRS
jgi:hypothetical protein